MKNRPMRKQNKSKIFNEYLKKLNYPILSISLLLIIICILAMWYISIKWETPTYLSNILYSVLGTVLSMIVAFMLWEVFAKRSFAKDVLGLASISDNLLESGIDYYYENFKYIKWEFELKYKKELSIVVVYAYTWVNSNFETLKEFTLEGGKIRVFLPNFKNQEIIKHYADRFLYTESDMKEKISSAIDIFEKLKAEIYLYDDILKTTFYMYDDTAIIAPFHHKKQKSPVPALRIEKGGKLFEFIESEINSIKDNSEILEEQ